VIVHHLVIDGISWRILLEDLLLAYGQLSRGQAVVLPPKTTSFQSWSRRVSEHASAESLRGELDYWLGVARIPVPPLPVDHPTEANTTGLARSLSVWLTREETRALLQEVPGVYHTQINDVLLTAVGEACARWTGHRSLLIDLEGHGREDILEGADVSRTIGWFTALFPMRLDMPPVWSVAKALPGIKEQLRRVPNRGIGFGILRYLAPDNEARERLRALPQAGVSFNYLGQVDAAMAEDAPFALDIAPESVGPVASPQGTRRHLLDIVGVVTGERLRVDWVFGSAIHEQPTIERLAHEFIDVLREIIAHCQSPEAGGYTPSDFPLANLDEGQLNTLLAQVEFEREGRG
jgi:non-ribosomal peptide synthase protein (TIGR01720 family)